MRLAKSGEVDLKWVLPAAIEKSLSVIWEWLDYNLEVRLHSNVPTSGHEPILNSKKSRFLNFFSVKTLSSHHARSEDYSEHRVYFKMTMMKWWWWLGTAQWADTVLVHCCTGYYSVPVSLLEWCWDWSTQNDRYKDQLAGQLTSTVEAGLEGGNHNSWFLSFFSLLFFRRAMAF